MSHMHLATSRWRAIQSGRTAVDGLPCWEQLPLERRRELILTLAEMLSKRLPARLRAKGVGRERAS